MTAPGSLSEQVLALPPGAGGVSGLGETFAADPYTGTGRYRIPIAVPKGHAGHAPSFALVYSSGAGAGVCGVGWAFGVGAVRRRTEKGLPTYDDRADTFLLDDDELVPVGDRYVLRSEGRFARIRHVKAEGDNHFIVEDRDGSRRVYGRGASARDRDGTRILAWHLVEICDANNNRVVFTYATSGNRAYLTGTEWGHGAFSAVFTYEDRPDVLRSYRGGFEHRTDQRLSSVVVRVRRTSDSSWFAFDRTDLGYETSPITGLSRLVTVTRTGVNPDDETHTWPVLTLGYATPAAQGAVVEVTGHTGRSLATPDTQLVDLDGDGLPDLVESTGVSWLLRRNQGDGSFARPVAISGPAARLREPGVYFSDARGYGRSDLVTPTGYYENDGSGFSRFVGFKTSISLDPDSPDARLVDLDGDGLGDLLVTRGDSLVVATWNPLIGFTEPRVLTLPEPLPRLADRSTRLADMTGDGLADLVRVSRGAITIYPNLGRGRFGSPRTLALPENLPGDVEPEHMILADVTGTGAADLLVRRSREVWLFPNGCGESFGAKRVLSGRESTTLEAVDLLGTGTKGLLFTRDGDRGAWMFAPLWQSKKPDVLATIDNGMGATTSITYGSSIAHAARDRAAGQPWRFPLPFAAMVVDAVTVEEATTGVRVGSRTRYHEGYYDGLEREFRGFGVVETIDTESGVDTTSQPPARTVRFFDLGNGARFYERYAPLPADRVPDAIPNHAGARRALRGMVLREEIYGDDESPESYRPYAITHHSYTVTRVAGPVEGGPQSFFAARTTTDGAYTERMRDPRLLRTTTQYDEVGRVVEAREKGFGRNGTFATDWETQQTEDLERVTATSYVSIEDATEFDLDAAFTPALIDRPITVELRDAEDTLLARERRFYDGLSSGLTRGRLTERQVLALPDGMVGDVFPSGSGAQAAIDDRGAYLDDADDLYIRAERFDYDDNGMIVASTDPRDGETTFEYDATYELFPIGSIDALDHPTTVTRDELPHRVASVVDANGNTTTFTYDPTGLPRAKCVQGKYVSSAWQGDPDTHPTEVYEYDFTSVPIRITTKRRQVRLGATFDVNSYIDGLGRTIQERHTAEPDPVTDDPRVRVTGAKVYNHKGLVVRAYQPTFGEDTDYEAAPTDTPFVETTYDALGRPTRIDHPDGTFETTTYHPWVRVHADRNDNGSGIATDDERYALAVPTIRDHLNTPTRTYVDAFGRDIAVAEDNGAGVTPTFRITTYTLAAGQFTGTSYDLTLKQNLVANYFVMIRGAVNNATADASNFGVRVTKDPFGTGDLDASSGAAVIRLERNASNRGDWVGSIVVWECLGDTAASGFQLVDVKKVQAASGSADTKQTTTATANTAWSDLAQVALYGGPRGGGSTTGGDVDRHPALHGKLTPSSTNSIALERWQGSVSLSAADFTVYVVQWGTEHTIERVSVTGSAGGDAIDASGEYNTGSMAEARRPNTWAWSSGWTKSRSIGESFNGGAVNLGAGTGYEDVPTTVARGAEYAIDHEHLITVHRHRAMSTHWTKKADGDSANTSIDVTVVDAADDETYDETSNPRTTAGRRVALVTHTMGATSMRYDRGVIYERHLGSTQLRMRRAASGVDFVAWVQSIDTTGVTYPNTASANYHVTRSVLDLKDQVIEVWDARGLADPTWSFVYDLAGQRLKTEHLTAAGVRYAVADAAGNPIWSRDARGIEMDRTFDALQRPLTESSDDGTTVKLRRAWNYIAYDVGDTTSKNKNLFGRVEEQRDTDGLRFFEYDWRGLVTKTSARFWNRAWTTNGGFWSNAWDDATPSTARGSFSDWLALADLTDTTTLVSTTTYDAAGRATRVDHPEGMYTEADFDEAGQVSEIRAHRGGSGDTETTVATSLEYDFRGKLTSMTYGNGVVATREYDPAIERLLRLFVKLPGSPETRYQDLNYTYDPSGNPIDLEDALGKTAYVANTIIPNTRTFRYDARYRLVRATGKRHRTLGTKVGDGTVSSPSAKDYEPYTLRYAYDEVGNFTANEEYVLGKDTINYKDDRIDLFNGDDGEATSGSPTSGNWRYDANGNTTKSPRHTELGYTFDDQVHYADLGGGGKVRYGRHGDQRTIRFFNKSNPFGVRIYFNGWEYERKAGTGAFVEIRLHVDGPAGRVAQIERVLSGTDSASLNLFFVHSDHLGNGQALTKSDGTLLSQEEYYPYGRCSDRRDSRNRYRFIGVERDEDTGLCMTGPRTYDPVSGLFLQSDPVASHGLSPYGYSGARPTCRVDRSGYRDRAVSSVPVSVSVIGPSVLPAPAIGQPVESRRGGGYHVPGPSLREIVTAILHPAKAIRAARLASEAGDRAIQWARDTYGDPTEAGDPGRVSRVTSLNRGTADALRHTFWLASMTVLLGERYARRQARVHENRNPKGSALTLKEIDEHNNEVGVNVGIQYLEEQRAEKAEAELVNEKPSRHTQSEILDILWARVRTEVVLGHTDAARPGADVFRTTTADDYAL